MRNQKRHKGITRIDQPEKHTHGWYVRVGFDGRQLSKLFPDKRLGGKAKALELAIAYRDQAERELGKPATDRQVVSRSHGRQKEWVGLRRETTRSRTKKGETRVNERFVVTWSPEPNVLRRTSFSIGKHGEENAFRMARELRQRMVLEATLPRDAAAGRKR